MIIKSNRVNWVNWVISTNVRYVIFFTVSLYMCSYSSVVERGRCSGNLVRRKFEQSTTVASQRHFGGHTGLLLQSLFNRVSSAPKTNTMPNLHHLLWQRNTSYSETVQMLDREKNLPGMWYCSLAAMAMHVKTRIRKIHLLWNPI